MSGRGTGTVGPCSPRSTRAQNVGVRESGGANPPFACIAGAALCWAAAPPLAVAVLLVPSWFSRQAVAYPLSFLVQMVNVDAGHRLRRHTRPILAWAKPTGLPPSFLGSSPASGCSVCRARVSAFDPSQDRDDRLWKDIAIAVGGGLVSWDRRGPRPGRAPLSRSL